MSQQAVPSPIADLSYRNYDGPLDPPTRRAKVIATTAIRQGMRKKGFWTWVVLSAYWYLILLAIFYFVDQFNTSLNSNAAAAGAMAPNLMAQVIWPEQFLNAFSIGQLLYFILALLLGSGSIANDNRSNALLVYLSKPVSKKDYLVGKWLGIFIPLYLAVLIPAVLFYVYCLLSYRQYGVLSSSPYMIFRLLLLAAVPATLHSSLSLGVSSLFNQGRLAGAAYAGLYFLPWFFTKMIQIFRVVNIRSAGGASTTALNTLFHCSVDGIQIAMAKLILGTSGSVNGAMPIKMNNGRSVPPITVDHPYLFIGAFFLICLLSLALAWNKVRAVEVVG